MFYTRDKEQVELDDVESFTMRPLQRPAPADNMLIAEDRAQAAQELADWTKFPFMIDVETSDGWRALYGVEARDFIKAWYELLSPWL